MDIRQYEYAVTIAEHKSISKAAERLHISQPTLSQFLSRLEKELGAPLFLHSRNGFTPTPAGEVYLEGARRIVETSSWIKETVAEMSRRKRSQLVIGMAHGRTARLFSEFLPTFNRESPEIEIQMIEAPTRNLDELARSGFLDLALVTRYRGDPLLAFESLTVEEIYFALNAAHPLAGGYAGAAGGQGRSVDLRDFAGEKFVLTKVGYRLRELIDEHLLAAGFAPDVLVETTENELTANMIHNGLAVGFLPEAYARWYDDLLALRFDPPLRWEFGAEYRSDAPISPHARRLIDLLKEFSREKADHGKYS